MSKSLEINVLFGDGSERRVTVTPTALSLVRRFAGAMPSLFEGAGLNPLAADFDRIVAVSRADHDAIHQIASSVRKADFRLGQMDMKASVCDMLRNLANSVQSGGIARAGLILAADLVESMEVPYADIGE